MRALTREEFPFVGPSNLSYSPYIDAERAINLYYEPSYAGGAPAFVGTPGLSTPLATVASGALVNAVRGLYAGNQRLFGAVGNHFYEFNLGAGGVLTDYGAMAGDGGTDGRPCTIVGGTAAPMLMVHNPQSKQTYFVNAATVDSKFNSLALEYLDGFFFAIATGASLSGTNPNQVNASAFNDGTTWSGTAFVIKEGSADAINQLKVVNNLLWVFGQQNIEVWYNAGLNNFPLARMNGGTINRGCLLPLSVVNMGTSVIWVGSSQRGWGQVYEASAPGQDPATISTPGVEYVIKTTLTGATGIGNSTAFAYTEAGHEFYVLTLHGQSTIVTLVYDRTTKAWHERVTNSSGTYVGWYPCCGASVAAAPNATYVKNFVGDRTNGGNIWQMGLEYTSDNGTTIYRQRTCSHIRKSYEWMKYPSFEVVADIGTASMTLSYSNNGGKSYPALNRPDATKTGSNDQGLNTGGGTYPRFKWWQCGRSRMRSYSVSILDGSNTIALVDGVATINEGTESRS